MHFYSKILIDHFLNPCNIGVIKDADGVGRFCNPKHNDTFVIYIKVKNDIIKEIKFQTYGCSAAIAASSMLTKTAKGKTIGQAETLTNKDIADLLGGMPANKLECSNSAVNALKMAIKQYKEKNEKLK